MESKIGKEQPNTWYNDVFRTAPHYHKPWNECGDWTLIWESTLDILLENNLTNILDIGSGMGQLGQLCTQNNIEYKGIDFSEYAIQYSIQNKVGHELFECVNANDYHYSDEVQAYTTHEFLEHVKDDLGILAKLKSNIPIIFSVPDSDGIQHTRFFTDVDDVYNRYSPLIQNLDVKKISNHHYLAVGVTK